MTDKLRTNGAPFCALTATHSSTPVPAAGIWLPHRLNAVVASAGVLSDLVNWLAGQLEGAGRPAPEVARPMLGVVS